MAGMRVSIRIDVLAVSVMLLLAVLLVPDAAIAGSVYTCDPGEVHQFWGCVNPEKPPPQACQPTAGNPVDVLTGRKHQEVLDWSSGGLHPLELRRSYSSSPFTLVASPYSSIGRGWRTNFDARARWSGASLSQATWVHVVLPDHFEYHFNKQNGVWKTMVPQSGGTSIYASSVVWQTRNDLDVSLSIDGEWIIMRTLDDREYVFDSAEHQQDAQYRVDGLWTSVLSEIRFPGGYVQKLSYSGDRLTRVADNFGRWIEMDYAKVSPRSTYVSGVRTIDGSVIKYAFENRFPSLDPGKPVDYWALSEVTYPDTTPGNDSDNPRVRYEYSDVSGKPGLLLSAIGDERGVRLASWTYDSKGRALTSTHAGGADNWQFSYDDAGNAVKVVNPLGRATRYSYRKIGALRRLLSVDGIASSNCAASNTLYAYDVNGFRNRAEDAEGRVTLWTRDRRGLPLAIIEAVGTDSQRSTSMSWDALRPRLTSVVEQGSATSIAYAPSGDVTRITRADVSQKETHTPPTVQARETRYAYAELPLATPPSPGPTGQALADVALPILNPDASNGVSGWLNLTGGISSRVGAPECPGENPCFSGGRNSLTIAYQDVRVTGPSIPETDSGRRAVRIGWRQWGNARAWDRNGDYSSVGLLFLDGSGANLGSLVTPTRKHGGWVSRSESAPLPSGTRTIRVLMLMYQWTGKYNALIDDLSLTLLPDGAASPDPFLPVVNPSALGGTTLGWAAPSDPGPVAPSVYLPGCPFCTYFVSQNRTGNSGASQMLVIPAERYTEIDKGQRGLALSWKAWGNSLYGEVGLSLEFADAAGNALGPPRYFSSPFETEWNVLLSSRVSLIPRGARRIKLGMITKFPPGIAGTGGWYGVTAQLVASPRPPSASVEVLTSIDGPLPGASDSVRYAYDGSGNLASVTDEVGHVTRITALDAAGRPLGVTDPNGVATTMAYDARGRLTMVTVNPGAAQSRTAIAYDAAGQVTRLTAPDGSFLQYTWSDARRLAAVTNGAGERIDYAHDAMGNVISRTVRSGSGAIIRQQSALFDELGRLLRSIGAAGQQTLFSYDRTDNLIAVTDPRGGLFGYAYDGLQRLAGLTDQTGAVTSLTRDGTDAVIAHRDPRGLTTRYQRNGFGEVIAESGPDVGTTVIERDARGLATRITDPRGVVTTLAYDAAGRLVKQAYPASPAQDVTYSYDDTSGGNRGVGRLTGLQDGSGRLSRRYDALGRIIQETREISGRSYVIAYAYNAAGRLTAITYPSGRVVSFVRNGLGRVSGVTMKASANAAAQTLASAIGWSPMSTRLSGLTHGNGLVTTRSHDRDGRLAALRLSNGATRVMDLAYGYGDGMNLTAVTDAVAPGNSIKLSYDAAQRLAGATGPWGSLAYGYTPTGDRAQETLTLPGGKPLVTLLAYPDDSNRLAQTSVNGIVTRRFTYDAAGNLVGEVSGGQRLDLAYNDRNRPVTITRTGDAPETSRYLYNALEQLVQRASDARGGPAAPVHYIYGLDGALLAEADAATGSTLRDYVWLPVDDVSPAADNDNEEGASTPPLPLAVVTGVNTAAPQLLMVHADHLGRPIRLTDMSRATVWQASYDPFGQPWQITGTVEQNLRFPGQYFLIETGLAYNWHRFYDPATGRYTQPEPLRFVDGASVYGYAGQSPMMRVDEEGLDWVDPIGGYYPENPSGNYPGFDFNPIEHPVVTIWIATLPVVGAIGGEVAAGGVVAACRSALGVGGELLGTRSPLFRRSAGLLNSNDFIRIGWNWNASARGGPRLVFRIAIGSKRGFIHRHWDIW